MSNEIAILDSGSGRNFQKTVRVRGGRPESRTDVEVSVSEAATRIRRRRKERRGVRWTRGKTDLHFRALDAQRERDDRSGTISLSGSGSFGAEQRERLRGRNLSERDQRIQKTIKGIPFNYFDTVSRLFTRLSVPNQRPYTDYSVSALSLSDNGNRIPLTVTGISTSLLDLGYSQKDFVVGAKAVFIGDEIIVEPTRADEERINLENLEPGQGILMIEYLALTHRIAHVFAKGQISAENHKKGLAMCVAVSKDLADSAVALLRTKYDQTMNNSSGILTTVAYKKKIVPVAHPQAAALKTSFNEMLSATGGGVAQLASLATTTPQNSTPAPVKVVASNPSKAEGGGKKLTLAELAKRK